MSVSFSERICMKLSIKRAYLGVSILTTGRDLKYAKIRSRMIYKSAVCQVTNVHFSCAQLPYFP